jgi:tRNA(Ile)-lysidine synthase
MAGDLLERLRRHLDAARILAEPGGAVVAVSGGADSLALLDLLVALAPDLGLDLVVAHADHGIQPESAALAARVRAAAAARYGLPTIIGALALGPDASETRARTARYRFLRAVQQERGARYLVTAHHADDQVETVLMRLLRGTAPAGLAGIPARGARGLVRPLLPFGRAELRAHVEARGLVPFDDPANADPRHTRSWLRTTLVPAMMDRLGPDAPAALLDVARHARDDVRAWDAVLDELPGLDAHVSEGAFDVARRVLSGYDKCLASRVLRAVAARAGLRLAPGAAARLARFASGAASGRRLDVPGGLVAEAAFGRLTVRRPAPVPEPLTLQGAEGAADFGRYRVAWRREPAPRRVARAAWTTWLAPGAFQVRAASDGDRLRPLGGVGRRKVGRLMMEAKVGRGERAAHPVLVVAGDVAWIPGVCRGVVALPAPGHEAVRVDVTIR